MSSAHLFETDRLIARPWTLEDAEGAHVLYSDPEVVRYIGGVVNADLEATRAQLREILARTETLPAGMGSFPLLDRATGEQIGTGMLKPLPDADNQRTEDIEVGWHVARKHWGKGFATEAGRGMLRYGFVDFELDVLHAVVDAPNAASHAVARRIGMQHVGTTEAYYGHELEHYVLRRSDWLETAG